MRKFYFKKAKGKIDFYAEKEYNRYIKSLKEGDYTIEISKRYGTRTLKQNSFYWLYLGIIEQETGETSNDLHELFKRKFLPPRFKTILGKEIKLPSTTTELDPLQFNNYIDRICAETGIPFPSDYF